MKKNVLLIAPYIHDFAAYDLWLKPLGLLYVAAAAEAAGYSVNIINCLDRLHPDARSLDRLHRAKTAGQGRGKFSFQEIRRPDCLSRVPRVFKRYGIPLETFRRELHKVPRPDAVGVGSMMAYWYPGVAETVRLMREVFPGVPVILGGIYATLCPAHAREHAGADYVLEGMGESSFVGLLDDLFGVGPREHALPVVRPAYHLLSNLDSVSMMTSRGCPFSCSYCASRLLSPGFNQRPITDVVDEIDFYVHHLAIRDIAFYDDALLVNPEKHIKPILRELIARKIQVRSNTPNGLHANMIDEELAHLMKAAGFSTLRLSVESVQPARMQDSCMKVTAEGFRRAVANLCSAGYSRASLEAYVLMGLPGQQVEEVEETMRLVNGEGVTVRLADFSPIPGTDYYHKAVESFGIDFSEPLLQNSSVLPYFVPGLLEQYRRLKGQARSLNARLLPASQVSG